MTRARIHLLLAAATLALFAFANWRAPLLNEDSVLYLVLAERISAQGFAAAFDLFDRPFYSALIALVHDLCGVDVLTAARLVNATAAVVLVGAFADFCRLLHRDDRLLPWAGLLLLAHPKLANCFALLVRDIGYWALLMASFCMLLRLAADGRLRWLAAWSGCVLGAAVFKPEAIAWGLLVPPGLLLLPQRPFAARARTVLLALLAVAAPALAVLLGFAAAFPAGGAVPDPAVVPRELLLAILEGFGGATERYATQVLDLSSRHVAAVSLAGGLLVILVAKLLNALGPLQLIALAAGSRAVPPVQQPERLVYLLLLLPALLLPAVFVAYRQFIDTRYVMVPMLLVLAMVVPCVRSLCERTGAALGGRAGMAMAAVALLFVADLALGLDRPKPYLLDCVRWMRAELHDSTRIFSNDVQIAAASGARWEWNEVHHAELLLGSGGQPAPSEYWILHLRDDRATLPAWQELTGDRYDRVREFTDGRGARVVVLRRREP